MKSTPHFDSIGNDNVLNITSAQYRTVNRFRNPFSVLSQKVEFSYCTLDFLVFFRIQETEIFEGCSTTATKSM